MKKIFYGTLLSLNGLFLVVNVWKMEMTYSPSLLVAIGGALAFANMLALAPSFLAADAAARDAGINGTPIGATTPSSGLFSPFMEIKVQNDGDERR